jgi:hypothetical protein
MSSSRKPTIPSGVSETQYRKALEAMRKEVISIDAAALQSEIAKKYALPGTSKSLISLRNVSNKAKSKVDNKSGQTSNSNSSNRNNRYESKDIDNDPNLQQTLYNSLNEQHHIDHSQQQQPIHQQAKVDRFNESIECDSCFSISSRSDICTICGYIRTINEPRQAVSLAEMRGLVAAPKREIAISKTEWDRIESKLDSRSDAHCPICMIGFNQGSEVLLSCSHMFHKACLMSFENFVGKSATRSCPICRTNNYQKRLTSKGSSAFQIVCAIKLTAVFRGYLARKKFHDGLKKFYKSGKGESKLRRRFYENELAQCTNNMAKEINTRDSIINYMMTKTDEILKTNKELDSMFDQLMQMRAANNQITAANSFINNSLLSAFNLENDDAKAETSESMRKVASDIGALSEETIAWDDVKDSAFSRGLGDCAICMTPNAIYQNSSESKFGSTSDKKRSVHYYNSSRQLSLLSCSHVFHTHCLINFEKFAETQQKPLLCPCCRSNYDRILLETGY